MWYFSLFLFPISTDCDDSWSGFVWSLSSWWRKCGCLRQKRNPGSYLQQSRFDIFQPSEFIESSKSHKYNTAMTITTLHCISLYCQPGENMDLTWREFPSTYRFAEAAFSCGVPKIFAEQCNAYHIEVFLFFFCLSLFLWCSTRFHSLSASGEQRRLNLD